MPYPLIALIIGGVFGAIGSFFAFATEGFGFRVALAILLGFVILGLCAGPALPALVVMAVWTFITGWLAAEYLTMSMEDGYFEETSVGTALKVLVVPPVMAGLGWLAVKGFLQFFQLIEMPVTVTADPVLKQWLMLMALGLWGSAIGAFPNIYLYVRGETMKRRAGR